MKSNNSWRKAQLTDVGWEGTDLIHDDVEGNCEKSIFPKATINIALQE